MLFDYFLLDSVKRDLIRDANNGIVERADEIWVFGPISNGVFAEIQLAFKMNKPVKYFKIHHSSSICPIDVREVEFEDNVYSEKAKEKFLLKLKELDSLGLSQEEYAISGSGPLAIRGIREAQDLDILATTGLWNILLKKHTPFNDKFIKIGNIEVGTDFANPTFPVDKIIKSSEKIEGYPFLSLEDTICWKSTFNREKDLLDIALIQDYLKKWPS